MKFTKWNNLNLLFILCGLIFFTSCSEVENYKEPVLVGNEYKGNVDAETQERAAEGVIKRLLGEEVATHFKVEMIQQEEDSLDVFEVESVDGKIVLRGS